MSNFAALIAPLSISGSRLSDGSPNASGRVWFFQPGGNTPVQVYTDATAATVVTQPVVLTDGGLINTADYPDGIFSTQPVRVYIEDSDASEVSDTIYIPATAGNVGVDNDGFTDSTLDDVLDDAFTSFGGTDWRYKQSSGATARTVKSKFSEVQISVKDFGALGDGLANDTTAIQAAISQVIALGGGVVFFPAGTYLIDQALVLASAVSVRLVGVGWKTLIQSSNATANVFTFSTLATNCSVESMRLIHASSTTGAAISVATGTDFVINNVIVTGSDFAYGADFSGSSNFAIYYSVMTGTTRGVRSNVSGSGRMTYFADSIIGQSGGTAGWELNGSQFGYRMTRCFILGTTGVLINSAFTGLDIVLTDNQFGSTTSIDTTGLATLNGFRQNGNDLASATSSATGAAQTPILFRGNEVILTAASGGAGTVTVNAPATLPGSGVENVDMYWDFVFKNAAGGAVTWAMNAVFVGIGTGFGGTGAVPTTDGHTIAIRFRWDRTTSKLREVSRADTVT